MAENIRDLILQSQVLSETYDLDSFILMLKRRGLSSAADFFQPYLKENWIIPFGPKPRFHRGHMLILLRLNECNHIDYCAGLPNAFDFEDIMSRRTLCSDLEAEYIKDDAIQIQQFFVWLLSNSDDPLDPVTAAHTKALIELSLNKLDPNSFYENLDADTLTISGTALLVKELIRMQNDIEAIFTYLKTSIPKVQYIYERQNDIEKARKLLNTVDSHYLAVPRRDINTDERNDFLRTRNELLIGESYEKLIDLYNSHMNFFDSEATRQANLNVCLGHIYGDLLKNSAKAADYFKEALEYDPGNTAAFEEVSDHLRKAEKWQELVELLSNHWDTIEDPHKRSALILETAHIEAFKSNHTQEAIGLYERCMIEGYPGNDFDNLYKIIAGLMNDATELEKMRALVTLTLHVNTYAQADKVTALQSKFNTSTDPLHKSMSRLVDAGIQSFSGDQPKAFEYLREAITLTPNNTLIDGLLMRLCAKMTNEQSESGGKEFREAVDELSSEALNTEDLSNAWLRIAKALHKLGGRDRIALDYTEKAVVTNQNNTEAIDLAFILANQLGIKEKAFIYATLKAAQAKDQDKSTQFAKIQEELKNTIKDDKDKLMTAYETLLQFDSVKQEISDGLRDLILSVDTNKANEFIQRIEPKCMASGLSDLLGDLYQNILDQDLSADIKKSILERYIGAMLAKGDKINFDRFIPAHAQLYAMSPNERYFTMLKTSIKEDYNYLREWTDLLEDAMSDIKDVPRLQKLYTKLAECYHQYLNDEDKTADTYAKLLKTAPDNAIAFKCCFSSFEQLERYSECIDICKDFPLNNLSAQERSNYCFRALIYALLQTGDAEKADFFLSDLLKDDKASAASIVDQIIDKANAAKTEPDHIISLFEQIENKQSGITAITLRIARAKLLAQNDRANEAIELLDNKTKSEVFANKLFDRAMAVIAMLKDADGYEDLKKLWTKEAAANIQNMPNPFKPKPTQADSAPKPEAKPVVNETQNTIDTLVIECAEHLEDESFVTVIKNALRTLNKEDSAQLCCKVAKIYEQGGNSKQAEAFFIEAFQNNQCYSIATDMLEFYKRQRKFKKALKVIKFKLDKAPDTEKNAVRLEWALICEQMRDFAGAITWLDEVLNNQPEKAVKIAVLKQKAAYLIALSNPEEAVNALKLASQEADLKSRIDIDIDNCLIMRQIAPADAQKLYQSLTIRGAKSNKMLLLSACFDIDNANFADAESKLTALASDTDNTIKIPTLEQTLRLRQARGDDENMIREAAQNLANLIPGHPMAKAVLG